MLQTLRRLQVLVSPLGRVSALYGVLGLIILFSAQGFSACIPGVGYAKFDFDGDCKADYAVYKTAPSEWWLQFSGGGITPWCTAPTGCAVRLLEPPVNKPVPADYDGNGKTDIGWYIPSTGTWVIVPSTSPITSIGRTWGSGSGNDIPQPADYNGDHKDDLGYYVPATGQWRVREVNGGSILDLPWGGLPGDKPVVGDYTGDGRADLAIVRTNSAGYLEWHINSGTGYIVKTWGLSTDIPVPADYDGDGKTDVAVYRPSTNYWWVLKSASNTLLVVPWGKPGDVPIPADYDGDGLADAAIYRPSSSGSEWWFSSMSGPIAYHGSPTDEPAPHSYIQP